MGRPTKSVAPTAPDKGSFPMDHFRECENEAQEYRNCLTKASSIPKKCKKEAQIYLQCRMDRGLMEKQTPEELGFVKESTWEFEQASREEMARKVRDVILASKKRVYEEYLAKQKVQQEVQAQKFRERE